MRITRWLLCATLIVSASCGDEADDAGPSTSQIPLATWVHQLVANGEAAEPDTVDDKVPILIDTDDEAAFDEFLTPP